MVWPLILLSVLGTDRVAEATFRAGVALEQSGQPATLVFARASHQFALAIAQHGGHPDRYLNLGNAEFLAGRLPEAIVAYRRGLRLDPTHDLLRANLKRARDEVVLPPQSSLRFPSTNPAWLPRAGAVWFVVAGCIAAFVGSLLLTRGLWVPTGLCLVALATVCALTLHLCEIADNAEATAPLWVVTHDSPLRIGNAPSYPCNADTPTVPRGLEVRLVHRRLDWLHVESGNARGWIPVNAAIPVTISSDARGESP